MKTRSIPIPAFAICIGTALALAVGLPCALTTGEAEAKTTTKSLTMTVGKTKTVSVAVPKKVKKASWKTSAKKVVAIKASGSKNKKCKLSAKKGGSATVTATVGGNKYNWKVTVKAAASTANNTGGTTSDNTGGSTGGTTTGDNTGGSTVTPTSEVVKWTTTEETFTGAYANQDESTGQTDIIPKTLTRKYVSFDPWPTTDAQVQYVIKNCDDPYVVASLYIVALDNYTFTTRGVYTHEYYKMLDSLMSGAGTLSGSSYVLSNSAKQALQEFHNKQVVDNTGTAINCDTFASRAYLAGATPENGYTPTGGLADKTKWQIVMDEYAYCGDLANGYLTVCPQRYTLEQATDGGEKVHVEHWQGIRIGMMKNIAANLWIPCLNTTLNNGKPSTLTPFNVEKQVLFSSNYIAPQVSQGF